MSHASWIGRIVGRSLRPAGARFRLVMCTFAIAGATLDVHAAGSAACRDESESGRFLSFEDLEPGTVLIRILGGASRDYPNFAIELPPGEESPLRFMVIKPGRVIEPAVLTRSGKWAPLLVSSAGSISSFTVETRSRRTVVRLWDPDATLEVIGRTPLESSSGSSGGERSRDPSRLGLGSFCAGACYAPTNPLCYDFERLECHLEEISSHPHAEVSTLGFTTPCPEALNHVPRAIYKVRITDPFVPAAEKTRILLTARVHGGERLSSFLVEGIMDYALGNDVHPAGGGGLPELPEPPGDLLRSLELVIYPMLNPDGAVDADGDGENDFNRYKCGVDMNRRWGTSAESAEAHEVHLVHEDILRESQVKPFAFHRDFHSWSNGYQGGFRHGVGTWEDENDNPAITVGEEYFERETALLQVEEKKVPYRNLENYIVNDAGFSPIPGSARFALFHEFGHQGLITNTSESSYVVEGGQVISIPAYRGGNDVRHEGAWLLLALYGTFVDPAPPPELGFIRGDVNDDMSVDLADAVKILLYLFTGITLRCPDSADLDENAAVNVSDAAYLLDYQFRDGPQPPAPFPLTGEPTSGLSLGCRP